MVARAVAFKVTAEMQQLQSPSCGEDKTLKNMYPMYLIGFVERRAGALCPYNGGSDGMLF